MLKCIVRILKEELRKNRNLQNEEKQVFVRQYEEQVAKLYGAEMSFNALFSEVMKQRNLIKEKQDADEKALLQS